MIKYTVKWKWRWRFVVKLSGLDPGIQERHDKYLHNNHLIGSLKVDANTGKRRSRKRLMGDKRVSAAKREI